MADWKSYLNEGDSKPLFKKKKSSQGCKRNKLSNNRYGACSFNSDEKCIYCRRPRRKETRIDPKTNTIVVNYFE